jgi:hypothetical protein
MSHTLSTSVIEADRTSLRALEELVDYQPMNQSYATPQLQMQEATMLQARAAKERARRAYYQACAVEAEANQTFHESMVVARDNVAVQYGKDSLAVKAVGRTRKSERKRPARRAAV